MTRRDQQMIADVLRSFGGRSIRPSTVARALAKAIARDDPSFRASMFLISCGVPVREVVRRK